MKKIHKLFFVYDFDKEEQWLNEMAMKGYKLVSVGLCSYTFEECEPGEYIIRVVLDDNNGNLGNLIEEMGAVEVARFFRWRFYARRSELGPFEINGDLDSKINHLSRIATMIKAACFANVCIGLGNNHIGTGWINLLVAMLLTYCWGRIDGKKDMLLKEREIYE